MLCKGVCKEDGSANLTDTLGLGQICQLETGGSNQASRLRVRLHHFLYIEQHNQHGTVVCKMSLFADWLGGCREATLENVEHLIEKTLSGEVLG
jgi:hypothetical protein